MSTVPVPTPSDEVFSSLLPFSWRGVEVPITEITTSLAHDLVLHQYWGVDGARVESTGLAPFRFHVSIPFTSGISPGKGESWEKDSLYPGVLRRFLAAFADRTVGTLQHPEFGNIRCKAEHVEFRLSGDRRGGMECAASFVQTLEEVSTPLSAFNPDGSQTLTHVTSTVESVATVVPEFPQYETSWTDLARSLQAVGDQVALQTQMSLGKLDAIAYRANALGDSVSRARSALTWPVRNDVERVKAAAYEEKKHLQDEQSKKIAFYLVPGDTTIAGVLTAIPGAKLADIVKLNKELMRAAVVPRGTLIRYYK